ESAQGIRPAKPVEKSDPLARIRSELVDVGRVFERGGGEPFRCRIEMEHAKLVLRVAGHVRADGRRPTYRLQVDLDGLEVVGSEPGRVERTVLPLEGSARAPAGSGAAARPTRIAGLPEDDVDRHRQARRHRVIAAKGAVREPVDEACLPAAGRVESA